MLHEEAFGTSLVPDSCLQGTEVCTVQPVESHCSEITISLNASIKKKEMYC